MSVYVQRQGFLQDEIGIGNAGYDLNHNRHRFVTYLRITVAKNLTVILFLLAFAAHSFNRAVIMLDYRLNTAAYAKNCENKAKPVMKCHGKCQLAKQVKAEEKKDQQNPERKLENKNEVTSSRSFFASYTVFFIASADCFNHYSIAALPATQAQDIFHPPAFV